jgi:uncharacterized protein YndB with AHSA1/START domain
MPPSALARKLHLKPGHHILLLNAPNGYAKELKPLPEGAALVDRGKDLDCVQLFVENVKELNRDAARAIKAVKADGLLWICYPKGSSKIKTDLSRDVGWDVVKKAGFEGVSLVAIDETWSAMRFRPASATKPAKKDERMSDEAVRSATGKAWDDWFAILDRAGGKEKTHQEIVAVLKKEGVSPWWQQMVTVSYERARGLRAKHERPEGFQVGRSKTIAAAASRVFAAWEDEKIRKRWLKDSNIHIHKATPHRSMRITWIDGTKSIDVGFYPKGSDKCQVTVNHAKLADAKVAERMKTYWEESLEKLKELLEA